MYKFPFQLLFHGAPPFRVNPAQISWCEARIVVLPRLGVSLYSISLITGRCFFSSLFTLRTKIPPPTFLLVCLFVCVCFCFFVFLFFCFFVFLFFCFFVFLFFFFPVVCRWIQHGFIMDSAVIADLRTFISHHTCIMHPRIIGITHHHNYGKWWRNVGMEMNTPHPFPPSKEMYSLCILYQVSQSNTFLGCSSMAHPPPVVYIPRPATAKQKRKKD